MMKALIDSVPIISIVGWLVDILAKDLSFKASKILTIDSNAVKWINALAR